MDKMSPDAVVAAVLFLLVAVRVAGVTFPLDSDDAAAAAPAAALLDCPPSPCAPCRPCAPEPPCVNGQRQPPVSSSISNIVIIASVVSAVAALLTAIAALITALRRCHRRHDDSSDVESSSAATPPPPRPRPGCRRRRKPSHGRRRRRAAAASLASAPTRATDLLHRLVPRGDRPACFLALALLRGSCPASTPWRSGTAPWPGPRAAASLTRPRPQPPVDGAAVLTLTGAGGCSDGQGSSSKDGGNVEKDAASGTVPRWPVSSTSTSWTSGRSTTSGACTVGAALQIHGGPKCFGEDYSMDFWSDDEDKEKMSRSHVFFEVLLMEGSPHMHKGRIWKTMRDAWDRLISTIHRWAILCKTALEVTLQQYIRDMEHKPEELLQIARH
ncbi:uncharacterized protein [Lolium perenne]|uniref:uncharacterized protein n=1 Tax=Lolium perenne TaxID=4522 RepID=UPI003A9A583B